MIGHTSKVVLEVVAASLVGLALIVLAGAWRLSQGPVSLAFLTPEIEEALNTQGAPVRVTIRDTILTWAGWARPLDVRVVGVRAIARDGRTVTAVPEMSVRFSAQALFAGVIAPTSLELLGPRVRLIRTAEGAIELAVGESGGASADMLAGLVDAISAPPSPGRPISYLSRVSILGAQLGVDDRMTGTVWGAPRADLVLARSGGLIRAEFGLDLDMGQGTMRLDGAASWQKETRRIAVEATVADLRPDRLAAKLPVLARASVLRMRLGGRFNALLDDDGRLVSARFKLDGHDGRLDVSDLWQGGLALRTLAVEGRFDADPGRLAIDALSADIGGPVISARGSAVSIEERVAIDGSVTMRNMPVSALKHYWPSSLAPKPRKWVTENMTDGTVSETTMEISVRAVPGAGGPSVEALSGAMKIDGTSVQFLDGLPPARKVDATAAFARDRFVVSIRKGELEGLRIDSGTVRLTRLDTDNEHGAIETVIRGPLKKVLDVIDRPRLGYARAVGISPDRVSGEAAVRLVITLPLASDVGFADIDVAAAANLRGVDVPGLAFGKDLRDGALTLRVDKSAMSIDGKATLATTPVQIKWYEAFANAKGMRRRYEVKGTFDEQARTGFGMTFAPWLRGPVAVDMSFSEGVDGFARAAVRLGLAPSTLAIPALGWTKPPGKDGAAFLTLALQNRRLVEVSDFSLATPDLRARGAIRFAADGGLAGVDITRFHLGATDISGRLTARAGGGYDITVRGAGFDAAPLLRDSGDADALPPLTIQAQVERLWFSTGRPVEMASGRLVYDGKSWRDFDVTASLDNRQKLSLRLTSAGTMRHMSFTASDAGSALRALNIAETVNGGRLVMTLSRDTVRDGTKAEAPWRGNVALRDISVVKAPILARLLSLASLTGIVNALSGKGIDFVRVDVPLVYANRVARIENARAVGSELGLTANGEVNLRTDRLRLDGTIVPAYTINSVLGNIPVLGDLLTGAKGSGVFAATYRMEGPLGEPKVSVNPLAALAPGFLRNLLSIFESGKGETPDADQPPAGPP